MSNWSWILGAVLMAVYLYFLIVTGTHCPESKHRYWSNSGVAYWFKK